MPATTRTSVKLSVLLDAGGHVAGAFKPLDYRPTKEGDEEVVTVGMVATPGQSVFEVDVPAEVANLEGQELLQQLAEQASVQAVIARTPTAGQASLGSSLQGFGASLQPAADISAGQGPSPSTQALGMGVPGSITSGSLG
jgi:hypothetical protein